MRADFFCHSASPRIATARTSVVAIAGTISHSFTCSAGSRKLLGLPTISAIPVTVTTTSDVQIQGM